MNPSDELPLFSWCPPECAIIAFPQNRRTDKVRQTATTLIEARTVKQHARYRSQIFDGIENNLLRRGIAPEIARREREAFIEAVENEIHRRTFGRASSRPDNGDHA